MSVCRLCSNLEEEITCDWQLPTGNSTKFQVFKILLFFASLNKQFYHLVFPTWLHPFLMYSPCLLHIYHYHSVFLTRPSKYFWKKRKEKRKKRFLTWVVDISHSLRIRNNKPMPKHLKCSYFNEQQFFFKYHISVSIEVHWLKSKCKYRFECIHFD